WLSGLLRKFRNNIQVILLGSFSTVTNVGIFSLASRINMVGEVAYSSVIKSVKPVFAEVHAEDDRQGLRHLYQTTTRWTFVLNLPTFLVLVLFPEAILAIFGQSFVGGASALVLLAWAQLANAGTGTCGSIIDMTGHTKIKLVNSVIWVILSIGTNFLLIPSWGIIGAAVAALGPGKTKSPIGQGFGTPAYFAFAGVGHDPSRILIVGQHITLPTIDQLVRAAGGRDGQCDNRFEESRAHG
ncbi:MAG: polysaccharide biosynthesis C-terminal domain-containing protein, partial [Kiloniellales bacterium]|nr:polysaccharide biosynthesis C-terminal domain-containing protein [Kiloniellales bacterium]